MDTSYLIKDSQSKSNSSTLAWYELFGPGFSKATVSEIENSVGIQCGYIKFIYHDGYPIDVVVDYDKIYSITEES